MCHSCDVRRCCNPKHLWLGTRADNNLDRAAKGRTWDQRGENNHQRKFSVDDIAAIRTNPDRLTGRALAKRFGVSPAAICMVRSGKRWGHV